MPIAHAEDFMLPRIFKKFLNHSLRHFIARRSCKEPIFPVFPSPQFPPHLRTHFEDLSSRHLFLLVHDIIYRTIRRKHQEHMNTIFKKCYKFSFISKFRSVYCSRIGISLLFENWICCMQPSMRPTTGSWKALLFGLILSFFTRVFPLEALTLTKYFTVNYPVFHFSVFLIYFIRNNDPVPNKRPVRQGFLEPRAMMILKTPINLPERFQSKLQRRCEHGRST